MKRLLAIMTAMGCFSAGIPALSASAENFSEKDFYVVAQNISVDNGSFCYLHSYSETRASVSKYAPKYETDYIRMKTNPEGNANYQYGDILLIDNQGNYSSNDSYPPHLYLSDVPEIHYAGNCKDILETRDLTLIKKENGIIDPILLRPDSITFTFEDSDGTEYEYLTYYYTNQPAIDVNLCLPGDTVTFSVYDDTLILPLELHRTQTASPGDVSIDGEINIMDVILLNKALFGMTDLTEQQAAAADINQDGKPDFSDSLMIMQYIVKLTDILH